jgi:hypothetical protein
MPGAGGDGRMRSGSLIEHRRAFPKNARSVSGVLSTPRRVADHSQCVVAAVIRSGRWDISCQRIGRVARSVTVATHHG